ncbi:MAG: hypothetical protein KKH75_06165 [Actinobacteria bacterium]|nr:hypothetical protein [Actinomycetota bacterium]
MTRTSSRFGVLALVLAAGASLAGCVGPTGAEPDTNTSSPRASSPVPTSDVTPTATSAAAPTCDTIIPRTTLDEFAKVNWTAKKVAFQLGTTELSTGIECRWADYSVPSDNLQIFGWAPLTKAEAQTAKAALLTNGWVQLDGADGAYITENPETTVAKDADGYGMTYYFGDGWVKMADTKQGLLLIEWPKV